MKGLNPNFSNFLFLVREFEKGEITSTVDDSRLTIPEETVKQDQPGTEATEQLGSRNAFDIMTEASKKTGSGRDIVTISETSVTFHGGSGGLDEKHRLAAEVIPFATAFGIKVYRRSVTKASTVIRDFCNLIWKIDGHLDKIESRKNLPLSARHFRQFIGCTVDECKFRHWNIQKKGTSRLSIEDVAKNVSSLRNSLDILLSTCYLPKEGKRRSRIETFFASVQALADCIDVYLDHVNDTAKTATGRYKNSLHQPFQHNEVQSIIDLETKTSGTIEAFQGSQCRFHKAIAPLIEALSAIAMYSPIIVDFDRHATAESSLWSLEKQGLTIRKYTMAATVRHARSKMRANIRSHGLPFSVGFFQEVIPGPVPMVFALWRIPPSFDSRSDSRQTSATQHASSHVKLLLSRHQTQMYSRCIVEIGKSRGTLKISSATALLEAFGFSNLKRSEADDCRVAKALSTILSSSCTTLNSHDGSTIDLAEDLRKYRSPKQGPLLSPFFAASSDFLNYAILSTGAQVDQRRAATSGGARMYMPIAMSLQDLMNRIQHHAESVLGKKLYKDFILPSPEWLRLQFKPPRLDTLTAAKFSGLLGLHRAVQTRTIRSEHEDCHFTRALWKYVRLWCHPLACKGLAAVVSVDDKCGVKIGEPGMPISALQRRRSSSICISSPTNENTQTQDGVLAADHDYTVMTLTPSVTLFIEPPQERTGSFMRGASHLTIKNAIFEASNPLRHASELANSLRHRYQDSTIPPVLVVFSDGGTDHRTNLYSVQLSFFWLMVELDTDEVVCVRTAPGDSWVNPAERRMAELNIAWEAASFARRAAPESERVPRDHARWFESAIKSANSMSGIRSLLAHRDVIANDIDIPEIVSETLTPVIAAMRGSVERLSTQVNEKWTVLDCATESSCDRVIQFLKNEVYHGLDRGKLQVANVEGTTTESILKAHKIESSRYAFHLRKRLVNEKDNPCNQSCPLCGMGNRLPLEVLNNLRPIPFPVLGANDSYKDFDSIYCLPGSELRPQQGKENLAPRAGKLAMSGAYCRGFLQCSNCNRKRAIYSRAKNAFVASKGLLEAAADALIFVCGSDTVFPDTLAATHASLLVKHPVVSSQGLTDPSKALIALRSAVYIQADLTCEDHVEESVYTSPSLSDGDKKICCFCGSSGSVSQVSRMIAIGKGTRCQSKTQLSRPFCEDCRREHVPRYTRTRMRAQKSTDCESNSRQRKKRKSTVEQDSSRDMPPSSAVQTSGTTANVVLHGGNEQSQVHEPLQQNHCVESSNQISNYLRTSIPQTLAAPNVPMKNPDQSTGSNHDHVGLDLDIVNQTSFQHSRPSKDLAYVVSSLPNTSRKSPLIQHFNAVRSDGYDATNVQRQVNIATVPANGSCTIPKGQLQPTRKALRNQSQDCGAEVYFHCAAGDSCFFGKQRLPSQPSHLCKNVSCPRRSMGFVVVLGLRDKEPRPHKGLVVYPG